MGVYTLEGVRQQLQADYFPCTAELDLFMVLSSPRKGTYKGRILLVDSTGIEEKGIRYWKFPATFEEDNEILPLFVTLENCTFRQSGQYLFQVWFAARRGLDVQKAEQPFYVLRNEE